MDRKDRIALFRYQVIAPLLALKQRGSLRKEIQKMTELFHQHPFLGPVRLGFGTIENWLYAYKKYGFETLKPRVRQDRGRNRAVADKVAEEIERLCEEAPQLTGRGILAELKARLPADTPLPSLTTLYRFLKARGLSDRRKPPRRDHRAYAFELPGDCWQADVCYGPRLPTETGVRRRVYLLAILDDATRLVPHAEFFWKQDLRSFKACLKQAFLKRGLPRRLYVDNGKIFRSRIILLLGARLGIQLIHSRPYRPQGRAKIERFFRRVRTSFLSRLDVDHVTDLGELNRLFWAWIEGEYHTQPHRGLGGECPLDAWLRLSEGIRSLPPEVDLDELFLEETKRRVAKDGTITLKGRTFEVGPSFIGERVTVRYDPDDLRCVRITGQRGSCEAFPVDLYGNRFVRRTEDPPRGEGESDLRSLRELADRMETESRPEEEEEE